MSAAHDADAPESTYILKGFELPDQEALIVAPPPVEVAVIPATRDIVRLDGDVAEMVVVYDVDVVGFVIAFADIVLGYAVGFTIVVCTVVADVVYVFAVAVMVFAGIVVVVEAVVGPITWT